MKTVTATIPVDIPEGYEAVRWGTPVDGDYCMSDASIMKVGGFFRHPSPTLVVRPIAPQMVPLGPVDLLPGVTLLRADHMTVAVLTVSKTGVLTAQGNNHCSEGPFVTHTSFEELQGSSLTYSNDHGKTWAKCEKPA